MDQYIVHLGFDQFTTDGSGPAGSISHYARLQDAAANHKYVQSVVSLGSNTHDFLGHPFGIVHQRHIRGW